MKIQSLLLGLAVLLIVLMRTYHLVFRPEWTEAQALRLMLPGWLLVIVLITIGMWLVNKYVPPQSDNKIL